jgi:Tol biopolymer transport system component
MADTQLVSVSSDGVQGNMFSVRPEISSDGRVIAFISMANNLSPLVTSPNMNIYVRRVDKKTTSLGSMAKNVRARGVSVDPAISGDGRYIAFSSDATNLVDQSSRGHKQIYVVDITDGKVTLASTGEDGMVGDDDSASPSLSNDGRYVAFMSKAAGLAKGCGGVAEHVYVRDIEKGVTVCVSNSNDGGDANGSSFHPSMSGNGKFVAFRSHASNLVGGKTNGFDNIYVKDLQSGATTLVSVADDKDPKINPYGDSTQPSISYDGQRVAFAAYALGESKSAQDAVDQIYVRDLTSKRTYLVSRSDKGEASNALDAQPRISSDGNFVAFLSAATNLVRGQDNGGRNIYRYDLKSSRITLVSRGLNGEQLNGNCFQPAISADGQVVAFRSNASNLVTGDNNFTDDVFVTDVK